jgi:hypothetical protein
MALLLFEGAATVERGIDRHHRSPSADIAAATGVATHSYLPV